MGGSCSTNGGGSYAYRLFVDVADGEMPFERPRSWCIANRKVAGSIPDGVNF
jgi:hypothetical protein